MRAPLGPGWALVLATVLAGCGGASGSSRSAAAPAPAPPPATPSGPSAPPPSGPGYQLIELPASHPYTWAVAMNDAGDVVGVTQASDAGSGDTTPHAFFYQRSSGSFAEIATGQAQAINNSEAIVISGNPPQIWRHGGLTKLWTDSKLVSAWDISDTGVVVGGGTGAIEWAKPESNAYAFRGSSEYPPTSALFSINHTGSVAVGQLMAGAGQPCGPGLEAYPSPYQLVQGRLVALPMSSSWWSGSAYAVNDAGSIVGRAVFVTQGTPTPGGAPTCTTQARAVMWSPGASDVSDLTIVKDPQLASAAKAINASGEIVGNLETAPGVNHAFLYANGAATDLNALIEASQHVTLADAVAINCNGDIAANTTVQGATSGIPTKAYLLLRQGVPRPACSGSGG